MVSEDFDHLGPGFLAIHRFRDLGDRDQTVPGQMCIRANQLEAARELLKVRGLRGPQSILSKERNDHFDKIATTMN